LTETRETFAGLAGWEKGLWYGLATVSTAIFLWGWFRLIRKYHAGRGPKRVGRPARRLRRTVWLVLTHAWIMRRATVSGLAHLAVFYGFVVLLIGTTILALQDNVASPLLGFDFWHGPFYLAYSLFLDVFGFALLLGLLVFVVRRGVERLPRLDYARADGTSRDRSPYVVGDWLFLGALLFLGATGFLLEALRIAETNPSFEVWSPAGWTFGQSLRGLGLDAESARNPHHALWWVHGVSSLAFVAAIPFTKALHMMTAPSSIATRNEAAGKRLPLPAGSGRVGYSTILDFTPAHLLQLDACTKCGKCHEVCPATATAFPLSPRDVVLDLREHAEGALGIRSALGVPPLAEPADLLVEGTVTSDTLWSCFQCMACVEICPVGIEQAPIINQLRRGLVDEGRIEPRLQATLETIYTSGNSFGESRRRRGRWASELPFDVKDIRKDGAEVLWFVGDYASFDPRNRRVTAAFARLLHMAGIDFGILYDAERNAGCDVRRAGEEGLYAELVEANLKAIDGCEFERIVTTDPHSFHTLKNEYPQFGGDWRVSHHSELLVELVDAERLSPWRPVEAKVTYHDPCKLGRYNGVYDAPRAVIAAVGAELVEMPRARDNSFCCGAGGGRIWMGEIDRGGARRPSELRIDEAIALGDLDYFVVACPKDVTMYEDAIKTSGHAGKIELREISELLLASLDGAVDEPAGAAVTGHG
jgi:Fe-S oxidoreductase/nitrate reductase gamma subunit